MPALHSRRAFLALAGSAAGVVVAAAGVAGAGAGAGSSPASNETATAAEPTATAPQPAPISPSGDHPMVGVDPARTGYDPEGRAPAGPVASGWCVGAGGAHDLSALAVVDGTVYSAAPSRGLRALDAATGERRWRASFDGLGRQAAPTVAGDRVFTTDGHAVAALGVDSGRELWTATPGERVTTPVLLTRSDDGDPETVFVATVVKGDDTRTSVLHALEAGDGSSRWQRPVGDGTLYGPLAARGDLVYGGGASRGFYAFAADTGEPYWRADLGSHATAPAVGRTTVFVGDEHGVVHACNRWTGDVRWTYETGSDVRTSPALAAGKVYVASTNGVLYALDAASGDLVWRFDGGRRLTVSPTVVGGNAGAAGGGASRDGEGSGGGGSGGGGSGGGGSGGGGSGGEATVLVGSGEGNVFGVDAASGEPRWSFQLPDDVQTPTVAVDGVVFVGDNEGQLHALVAASATLPEGARSCATPSTPGPDQADATDDADGDGVADRHDYAPRDGSVQDRGDLAALGEDDDRGFLSGIGVGVAGSLAGVGVGWLLGRRGSDSGSASEQLPRE